MRRLIAALIIVVILAAAWVGGWFWLAGWVDRNAEPTLAKIARRGVEVDCQNRTIVGFPFALRVACGKTAVAERSTGTHANLAGATGGASVFRADDGGGRAGVAGPGRIAAAPGPLEFRWTDAAVDVGLGMNGPRTVSFDADRFPRRVLPSRPAGADGRRGERRGASRALPSGGSAVALAFTDLAFATGGTRFPPVTGKRHRRALRAAARARLRQRGPAAPDRGARHPGDARKRRRALHGGGRHRASARTACSTAP